VSVEILRDEFDKCWREYPRKNSKKKAFGWYVSARRRGLDPRKFFTATVNYKLAMLELGTGKEHIKHGDTWFGPDNEWEDYLNGNPDTA
jgi:hypothetical protein